MAANWTAFVSGAVLEASQLNGVVDNFADIAIFNETQASNTSGGGATGGSYLKRTLNTTVVNNITGCTLASSVISLPAGTYHVFATASAISVDRHQARLRNTTDSTDIEYGNSNFAAAGNTALTTSNIQTVFTLAGTKDIELQHRVQTTSGTQGFGIATNFGNVEIYSSITIIRVA